MRLFDEHVKRNVQCLDGVWKFSIDENKSAEVGDLLEKNGKKVIVPSCWNNDLGLIEYVGVAWYEKKFYTKGGTLRFCFDAVMTEAEVFLDGEKLGYHYGGFCEFSFIKHGVKEGQHSLVVRVSNEFDKTSIPQVEVDWWHYGGITRSVSVETLEGVCALYNRTEYVLDNDTAKVKQFVELYNAGEDSITDTLCLVIGDKTLNQSVKLNPAQAKMFEFEFELDNVRLWDIDDPYLYTIKISTSTDDLYDRTGFRKVEVKKDGIYLNDKRREIRGVNRHEEHPDWGMAFPERLMKRDLDIIVNTSANAIRGAHYPNARIFMDYCDEMGFMFWSEIPIWGVGFAPEVIGDKVVVERGLDMHKEMVHYYYNHPSIIMWGMHNEICTNRQEGYEMSKVYYNYLKENGGNRVVTYASKEPDGDICFEFCDVVSINYYIAWYGKEIEDWAGFVKNTCKLLKEQGFGDKPIIFSEFGAAAIYGNSTFEDIRWTEEYQARLIKFCLDLFHETPEVCGAFVWQLMDIRAKNADLNRARCFNNKGILNEYRKPKLAYYAVKDCFSRYKKENNE